MKIKYDKVNKVLILTITEEIDQCWAEKIRNRADFEIQRYMPKQVIFDFGNVTFMDSSGIGMIIGRYKTAEIFGGKLYLINVKKNIKKVLEMSGILKIIPIIEEIGGEYFEECI